MRQLLCVKAFGYFFLLDKLTCIKSASHYLLIDGRMVVWFVGKLELVVWHPRVRLLEDVIDFTDFRIIDFRISVMFVKRFHLCVIAVVYMTALLHQNEQAITIYPTATHAKHEQGYKE